VTSSELVVNADETEFECTISSKVDVIDCVRKQRVKFSPKSSKSKFRARLGGKVRCIYVMRRKTGVLVTPVAVREQWNASVVGGTTVACAIIHAQVQ